MIKKIGIILFVLAILVTGYLSFKKLSYWDRSVMIFKYDSSQPFNRGRDGTRQRMEGRGQRNVNRMRPGNDSLNTIRGDRNPEFSEGGGFPGGTRGQEGRGGRDFRRGSTVNLDMVLFYLGVFALFTLITVYIEKGYRLIFKQKKLTQENSDLII